MSIHRDSGSRSCALVSERAFQATVVETAKLLDWRVFHTFDSRRTEPGFPDLVLVRDRVLFAELKTERGRVTAEQAAWIADLRAADADVRLWRPSDWREIEQVLA